MSNSGEDSTPSDVIAIDRLLATAGIERYEPRVINQLLEVAARMTRELLVDADDIREHGRNQVQPTRHPVDVKEIEAADALRAFSTYTAPTITQVRLSLLFDRLLFCLLLSLLTTSSHFPPISRRLEKRARAHATPCRCRASPRARV
jgi:hypothetical protein